MKTEKTSVFPSPAGINDVAAIQAIARGDADSDQQKKALSFIINQICGTYNASYRQGEDGSRDTAFLEGRRSVGLTLVSACVINIKQMKEPKDGR